MEWPAEWAEARLEEVGAMHLNRQRRSLPRRQTQTGVDTAYCDAEFR